MLIEYRGGMKLVAHHLGFSVSCDQPVEAGGENTAITPTAMFVASFAMCVGTYVLFFAKRHAIPVDGLRIEADYQMSKDPYRVSAIQVKVAMPQPVSQEHLAALQSSAESCVVHNSLTHPPAMTITIS